MSDSEPDTELDEIRQKKIEQLQQGATGGESESPSEPVHLENAAEYQQFMADHDVVLVDFYADWCGPCKMIEPIVEDLAANTDATVLKVDIDTHQGLASQMGIRGVPTMYLYANGEPVDQMVGVQDKATLQAKIDQYV